MNFENLTPRLKLEILEAAVLYGTPEEVSELFGLLGKMPFTARALGYACRYRGLDMVKTLVNNGATFNYDADEVIRLYRRDVFDDEFGDGFEYYSAMLLGRFNYKWFAGAYCVSRADKPHLDDRHNADKRLEILEYLYGEREKIGLDINELLYYSHIAGEPKITAALQAHGAVISEKKKNYLSQGAGADELQKFYCALIIRDDFEEAVTEFLNGLNGYKIPILRDLYIYIYKQNYSPRKSYSILGRFDLVYFADEITDCAQYAIGNSDLDELICIIDGGCIQSLKQCRGLIDYSAKSKKTECTAALMNFMNTAFEDELKQERMKLLDDTAIDEDGISAELYHF